MLELRRELDRVIQQSQVQVIQSDSVVGRLCAELTESQHELAACELRVNELTASVASYHEMLNRKDCPDCKSLAKEGAEQTEVWARREQMALEELDSWRVKLFESQQQKDLLISHWQQQLAMKAGELNAALD